MNDMSSVEAPKHQLRVEQPLATKDCLKVDDAVVTDRLKNTLPEKARFAARLFIGKAALAASAFYLLIQSGCGNAESPNANSPSPKEQTPASAPLPSFATPSTENLSLNKRVILDKDGFAVKYVLPDGKKVSLDREEVKKLSEKAIASGEPEIIAIVPKNETPERKFQYTPEKPRTRHLPKDVLSPKELKKRGITIIQPPPSVDHPRPVNLFIREGAFKEGERLAEINRIDHPLTIVLVDGPFLGERFLQDSRYDTVRPMLKQPNENQEEIIERYKQSLINSLEDTRLGRVRWIDKNERILLVKAEIAAMAKGFVGKEAILTNMAMPDGIYARDKFTVGLHVMRAQSSSTTVLRVHVDDSSVTTEEKEEEKHPVEKTSKKSTIFVSVGEQSPKTSFTYIYFKPNGSLAHGDSRIGFLAYTPESNMIPKARQTHPNPKDFKLDSQASHENNDYPYGAQTPGLLARHEDEHIYTFNEFDADMNAMEGIKRAYRRWVESGFTDNSGYYFVFSLPPEEGGGYILTEHKPSSDSTAPYKL